MNATVKFPSAATCTIVIDALKGDVTQANRWKKAADALSADGVTAASLATVKKGGNEDLRTFVKAKIVMPSFTAAEQRLLETPTKGLSDEKKGKKATLQMDIGSRFSKIERHLKAAEEAAAAALAGESEGAGAKKPTREDTWRKTLSAIVDQAQKAEGAKVNDVSAFIKALKDAIARIK